MEQAASSLRHILAVNLRRTRKAQGLTQEKLAELSHMSANQISHVENGEVSLGLNKLAALALALGKEPGQLLTSEK
ncbi:MAG: helix-turn-helix transcriptional regulator [Clostridiales bacterium]|nr:helix-turn-helix transcriptional regulator [Clostridiales bacterium]